MKKRTRRYFYLHATHPERNFLTEGAHFGAHFSSSPQRLTLVNVFLNPRSLTPPLSQRKKELQPSLHVGGHFF